MRDRLPTPAELAADFDRTLAEVLAGGGITTGNGFDTDTENALWAIARAHPDVPDALIAAARTTFAAQQDGTRAAARDEALARKIAALNARRR